MSQNIDLRSEIIFEIVHRDLCYISGRSFSGRDAGLLRHFGEQALRFDRTIVVRSGGNRRTQEFLEARQRLHDALHHAHSGSGGRHWRSRERYRGDLVELRRRVMNFMARLTDVLSGRV